MKGILHSKNLEAFYAVAQIHHFGRAAELINITPSALSQRISTLEEQLGVRLFDRDPSGPQLTEAGERLLRYCLITGGLQDELLHDLIGVSGIAGAVTIAGFSSAIRSVVMPSLSELMLRNPHLRIHFAVADMVELRDKLLRGHADFIVTHVPVDRCGYRSVEIGAEINVLVESEKENAIRDVYLDHNQADDFSETFLRSVSQSTPTVKRGFCHDIYGILEGVALGMGRGAVPVHLVQPGSGVRRVPECRQALVTPVLLQFPAREYTPVAQRMVGETLLREAPVRFASNPADIDYDCVSRAKSDTAL